MKVILQDNRRYILRFDKDEEVISGLVQYARDNNIQGAYISGIGSCSTVELGFFNPFLKEYRKKPFLENVEILGFSGTIARQGEEPIVHAHGSFAGNEFSAFGGHVFSMKVLATCEVFLIVLDGQLQRQKDSEWGLNLLAT
jgi:uncharacterized protein